MTATPVLVDPRTSEVRWRRLALIAMAVALASLAVAIWALRRVPPSALPPTTTGPPSPLVATPPPADRLVLAPASFADLPGFGDDALAAALPALRRSCGALAQRPVNAPIGPDGFAGRVGDWLPACAAAAHLAADDATVRAFLTDRFQPLAVTNNAEPEGLFTGYYEPILSGSRRRHDRFTVPLYLRPPDLVGIDLGDFRPELAGQRVAGRLEGGALRPYPDRAAIDRGALAGRRLEVVWVDDPLDAFFVQVQGSGRVELAEGGTLRLGYAAQNGHPYTAIGRELVARGALRREEVALPTIRAWLRGHPREAPAVLDRNPSYVFFRILDGGVVGSQGVELEPGRSLAVDPRFLPLGVPLWLAGTAPAVDPGRPDVELRRLVVAQDTGGAIRGPVRGDVFFGAGADAEAVAGRMKHRGRLWLLVPKAAAATALGARSATTGLPAPAPPAAPKPTGGAL